MRDVAESGGGKFYMIDETMSALSKLDSEINKLEKQEVEQRSFTDYNSYFQLFLLPAILILIWEFLFSARSTGTGGWRKALGIK